jgi:hypothetical protein
MTHRSQRGQGFKDRSDLREATVDEQIDTRDEAAVPGREKQHGGRDFLGATDASQWCCGSEFGAQFVCLRSGGDLAVDDRRVDGARTDRPDANATVLELDGPCPRERANGRLRRAIGVMRLQAFDAGDRARSG